LQGKYSDSPIQLGITAPTGTAACNISGVTLQSWAGITPNHKTRDAMLEVARWNPKSNARWRLVKTLIIDESNLFALRLSFSLIIMYCSFYG
jgi:ATP-dependent DNA helicase PIF1